MGIIVRDDNVFILDTKNTHYVLGVDKFGINRHLYWGDKCSVDDYEIDLQKGENAHNTVLDEIKQEYSAFGSTMYRDCAVKTTFADGCRELDLRYFDYKKTDNTLSLILRDSYYPLELTLNYGIFENSDIISRWITAKNIGDSDFTFEKLSAAEFNLPSCGPYIIKNTNGSWGGEYIETDTLLSGGSVCYQSRSGISGHNNSPYFIAHQNADENNGDVYFASFAFSGNFKINATRDLYRKTRIVVGLNDFDFEYTLEPGGVFESPKAYCGYTHGFGDMTRLMNRFALEHIFPESHRNSVLPVLYNSWEATYFDVNYENQSALAEIASEIGVELFVMDDGWFGKRDDDNASLGDWVVSKKKFPHGLKPLIDRVNELGMDFGLWVEPEMVNPDSDLYRLHPDWTYHYEHRDANELRNQLVLNMTRSDVQEYIFNLLDTLLTENNIKYIKWDMNRPFSESGGENLKNPKMLWYLHTMAVYDIVDRLKKAHPQVAFESCASGGGRSDLGAMEHYDMVWTSDNTDGIDRMTIQRGFSLLRPVKAMRAWVTDIEGINKPCSLDFRFAVAMQGSLGIGGKLTNYSENDIETCKKYISLYKKIREIVQFGDLYRVLNVEDDEVMLNHYVSPDKKKSVAFITADATRFYKKRIPLKFSGLDRDKNYKLTFDGTTYVKSGAYLENAGVNAHIRGAYYNKIILIEQV